MDTRPTATPDPWSHLREHTAARIALGRAGGSLPTAELLRFSMDHAEAQDTVRAELDLDRLEADLRAAGADALRASTRVTDRPTYLQRPDLGRRLDAESLVALERHAAADRVARPDVAIVVSDGLSAPAAQKQAPVVVGTLLPLLAAKRLIVAPIVLVRYGRVAVEDEIGQALGVRLCLILLGERPGLGTPDSLGAYLVHEPKVGRSDADRNCVSNIRLAGLPPEAAAQTLAYLIGESITRRISGVGLKDERGALPASAIPALPPAAAARPDGPSHPSAY